MSSDPGAAAPDNRWFDHAVAMLANLGFQLVGAEPGTGDGTSHLFVAIRPAPTEQHFDPEAVEYWVVEGERGRPARLDRESRLPLASAFSWGQISVTDRLGVRNEFLTFGGTLRARNTADGTVIADFNSPAPILRWSGHSQTADPLASEVTTYFGRLKVPIDFVPGSEALIAATGPGVLYCAFIQGVTDRLARSPGLREANRPLVELSSREARRLQQEKAGQWQAATELRLRLDSLTSASRG